MFYGVVRACNPHRWLAPLEIRNGAGSASDRAAFAAWLSNQLERHGGGLATADAKARHAALQAVLAQAADQGHERARARGADRMAERAGAAVDVVLVVRQVVLLHRRHGDHREGLVDLVEVDVLRAPPGALEKLADRADGCGGEPSGLLRMRRMAHDD